MTKSNQSAFNDAIKSMAANEARARLSPHLKRRADRLASRIEEKYAFPRAAVSSRRDWRKFPNGSKLAGFWREVWERVLVHEVASEYCRNGCQPTWFYFGANSWRLVEIVDNDINVIAYVAAGPFVSYEQLSYFLSEQASD